MILSPRKIFDGHAARAVVDFAKEEGWTCRGQRAWLVTDDSAYALSVVVSRRSTKQSIRFSLELGASLREITTRDCGAWPSVLDPPEMHYWRRLHQVLPEYDEWQVWPTALWPADDLHVHLFRVVEHSWMRFHEMASVDRLLSLYSSALGESTVNVTALYRTCILALASGDLTLADAAKERLRVAADDSSAAAEQARQAIARLSD